MRSNNIIIFNAVAWYDLELATYQKERQETELEKFFDERNVNLKESGHSYNIDIKPKDFKGSEAEWQHLVKSKKGEEYYNKLQELENSQVTKEFKLREASHQFAIPGEKIVNNTMAKGMAAKYQESL